MPFSGVLSSQITSTESAPNASKVWTPQPHHRVPNAFSGHQLSHTCPVNEAPLQLSCLLIDDEEELHGRETVQVRVDSSPEVEVKKRSHTLPIRGASFTSSSEHWPPREPRDPFSHPAPSSSSSSSLTSTKSNMRGSECGGTPTSDVAGGFLPPSVPPVVGRNPRDTSFKWVPPKR